MTLTQLNAFVMVARLRSVTAAAHALGSASRLFSQALSALRQHLGDPLITRGPEGMTLNPGRLPAAGDRFADVALGAEAHAAVRAAQGAAEQLRNCYHPGHCRVRDHPLMDAFGRQLPGICRDLGQHRRQQRNGGHGREPASRHRDRPPLRS